MTNENLDNLLRETAAETRFALDEPAALPQFEPNSNRGAVAVGAIVVVALVAVGGWLSNSFASDPVDVQTAETPQAPELDSVDLEEPSEEDAEANPTTTTDRVETAERVVDLETRQQADVAQPAFGESYVDPAFGTTITRATSTVSGERVVPLQSPGPVWNADESMLLLYRTGADFAGHIFVDTTTFETVGELAVLPTDIEQIFWHPTEADLVVMVTQDSELVAVSATSGERTTLATFPECDSVDPGIGTAGPSLDGTLIALRCFVGDGVAVLSQPLDGTPPAVLEVNEGEQGMASPDGRSVIIETATGFDIYDAGLNELTSSIEWRASSPTVGVDAEENATILSSGYEADFPALLAASSIDGGSNGASASGTTVQVIVGPDTGYPFPASGARISASGWNAPGLFVAASPLPEDVVAGAPIEAFDGEVLLADTTVEPPLIQRLAHTRNTAAGPFSEAYVSISPSGRFVAFASDFGGDTTDTYIIDLEV